MKLSDSLKILEPPPRHTVSQWADKFRILSRESSAEPGEYKTSRTPYLKEIMDSVNDPKTEIVVFMKSSQVGATEALINVIGYFVDSDPSPILMVQPTISMSETVSKDRITTLFRDTPSLHSKLSAKTRDKGTFATNNTLFHKVFPGGHLTLVGANSPSSLASRPIRILLLDEIDRFPPSAGSEGDPVQLAIKRTTTFRNRKILITSTPTTKNNSRIEKSFLESDQRYFYIPCPYCNKEQKLEWAQVKYEKENYKKAKYHCLHCDKPWNDLQRWTAIKQGHWIASEEFHGIAGFHISELYSPWVSIATIVKTYLEAKRGGEELEKVWTNTALGLPFEEDLDQQPVNLLQQRAEDFSLQRIPNNVVYMTMGIDTQGDRLESSIIGWGQKQECYVLEHIAFTGPTVLSDVWQELEKFYNKTFLKEDGTPIKISVGCLDSGGHSTLQCYTFSQQQLRKGNKIYAIKGSSNPSGPIWEYKAKKSSTHKAHRFYFVGSSTAKDALFSRLKLQMPGENFIHFSKNLTTDYYRQLTSESPKWETKNGRPVKKWVMTGTHNETLDCFVYNLAALYSNYSEYERLCREVELSLKKPEPQVSKSSYLQKHKY